MWESQKEFKINLNHVPTDEATQALIKRNFKITGKEYTVDTTKINVVDALKEPEVSIEQKNKENHISRLTTPNIEVKTVEITPRTKDMIIRGLEIEGKEYNVGRLTKKNLLIRQDKLNSNIIIGSNILLQQQKSLKLYNILSHGDIAYYKELCMEDKTNILKVGYADQLLGIISHSLAMFIFNQLPKNTFHMLNYENLGDYVALLDQNFKSDFILLEKSSVTNQIIVYLMDVKTGGVIGCRNDTKVVQFGEETKHLFPIKDFENILADYLGHKEYVSDLSFVYHRMTVYTGFSSVFFEIEQFEQYIKLLKPTLLHTFEEVRKKYL